MNKTMFKTKLKELNACQDAIDWVGDKTFEEAYASCHRGDWMLWLFTRMNPDKFRERVLAAGHCANTVRHLMTDPRSLAAVDAAIAYGEGRIGLEALEEAAAYAYAAVRTAYGAASVAYNAANAAFGAFWVARVAYGADCVAGSTKTADIVRQYLPIEIWRKP